MLNEHQRRRLSVRLGRLVHEGEALLEEIESERTAGGADAADEGADAPEAPDADAAEAPDADAPRAREPDPATLAGEVRSLLAAARDAAGELGVELGGHAPTLGHRVQAWSAAWWTRILDCAPERMGGLGPIDPEDERTIGDAVDRVAARLARLQRLSSGRPGGGGGEGGADGEDA